jgi:hypothetical protein
LILEGLLQELHHTGYERVRPLLDDLVSYQVSIDGVLQGHNPGVVYVDDLVAPRVVLLLGPEGAYLGGEAPTAAHVTALKTLVADLMIRQGLGELWLDNVSTWDERLADLLPWPPLHIPRQHYICTALVLDWRAQVPYGFEVLPIS